VFVPRKKKKDCAGGFRHVTYPTAEEGRDPKPPPFRLDTKMAPTEHVGVYTTPHGVLAGEVMDQFALHSQWKTASQMAYVLHNPPYSVSLNTRCSQSLASVVILFVLHGMCVTFVPQV